MTIFYIFAILAFLSVFCLFCLSITLFNRMNTCLDTVREVEYFHKRVLNNIQYLEKEVSGYRDIAKTTKFKQEELDRAFEDLKDTATELQSSHKAKKAVFDLMKR